MVLLSLLRSLQFVHQFVSKRSLQFLFFWSFFPIWPSWCEASYPKFVLVNVLYHRDRNCPFLLMILIFPSSEIERQNPQTTASDEPTRVRRSKRRVACCICRWNSQHLHESSNHPRLDKKQVVSWMNERNKMWQWSCVNWIPFRATMKERNKKWQAKWFTSKFKAGTNVSCM